MHDQAEVLSTLVVVVNTHRARETTGRAAEFNRSVGNETKSTELPNIDGHQTGKILRRKVSDVSMGTRNDLLLGSLMGMLKTGMASEKMCACVFKGKKAQQRRERERGGEEEDPPATRPGRKGKRGRKKKSLEKRARKSVARRERAGSGGFNDFLRWAGTWDLGDGWVDAGKQCAVASQQHKGRSKQRDE